MTVSTPAYHLDELADAEALFASVKRTLGELREEIESLKERARAGEDINATAAAKTISAATDVIGRCQKAELMLYDCRNRKAGIARGGVALDLDRVRADIGCKLDRLRRAIGTGTIPE